MLQSKSFEPLTDSSIFSSKVMAKQTKFGYKFNPKRVCTKILVTLSECLVFKCVMKFTYRNF